MTRGTLDRPGFADPVQDAQNCFRAVLDACSHPGRVLAVEVPGLAPPPVLDEATAAVLLTLLDADTPVFLHPALAAARPWLAFHCGSPFAEPGAAAFAVASDLGTLPDLPAGTDEEPQGGATLVLQVPSLQGGAPLRVSGPGVDGTLAFAPAGLPVDFAARWAANHARFPRGVDLLLCAGTGLAALPRSVRVEA